MDRDDRDRKEVGRRLQPVLDEIVARLGGMLGRERPASGPELDPGKPPERLGALGLVAVAPRAVLALEQVAGLVEVAGRRRSCSRRPTLRPARALAADRHRELGCTRCSCGAPSRRRCGRGWTAPRGLAREASRRRAPRRAGAPLRACSSARTYPFLNRVDHASRQWMSDWSAGLEAAARALPPAARWIFDARELRKQHECLGAFRASSVFAPEDRRRCSGRGSTRPRCGGRGLRRALDDDGRRGVRRASAEARARRARPRPPARRDQRPALLLGRGPTRCRRPAPPPPERGDARERADRRPPRAVHAASAALRRTAPGRGPTRAAGG